MKNVIVFPTRFHIEFIKKHQAALCSNISIVYTGSQPVSETIIEVVHENDFSTWAMDKSLRFLPCSEAALYFMWHQRCHKKCVTKQFSDRCYDLFLKSALQETLTEAGIPHIEKELITDMNLPDQPFPFIAKPNFGFGSQMVAQIKTPEEFEKYALDFRQEYSQNIIEQFRVKYLSDLGEDECKQILVEDDRSDLCFASVPFIVEEGAVSCFFPTIGRGTLISNHLSEHKVVFNYPCHTDIPDFSPIKSIIDRLHSFFELKDGVYHSEFLCDQRETYLVEFSPRLTGEAISRMISFSEGMDLAGKSITLFLNINIPTGIKRIEEQMQLLRIYSQHLSKLTEILPPDEKIILTLSKTRPESVSMDIISTV